MTRAEAIKLRDALLKAYRDFDRFADSTNDRIVKALLKAQKALLWRVEQIAAGAPDFTGMPVVERLAWYAGQAGRLDTAIRASGYYEALGGYVKEFERLSRLAERLMQAGGVSRGLASVSPQFMQALQRREWDRFLFLGREASWKLDDVFLDMVIGGTQRASMLAELRGVITGEYPWGERKGLYEWHTGTYVRTATHRHMQGFLNQQAQDAGLERYMYVGPLDPVTREFCAPLVGHTFTRDEIDGMDNGQSGDVFSDGGGWNCRHEWVGVTDELADALAGEEIEPDGSEE